jgi:CBS domain-containing protein
MRRHPMRAKDVMTTNVITVLEDTPVEEVASILLTRRISAVPVIDSDDAVVGIVSEGDLVRRSETDEQTQEAWWLTGLANPRGQAQTFARAWGLLAKDVMSTSVITADEDDSLAEIARTLERHRIKRVPIVRHGKLVGIVSRANLLHGLAVASGEDAKPSPPPPTPPRRAAPHTALADDRSTRAMILNAIHNEIGVRTPINVIVMNGVVDLWGGVETEAQQQAVRAAAETARNVKAVNDHLTVFPPALRLLLKSKDDRPS